MQFTMHVGGKVEKLRKSRETKTYYHISCKSKKPPSGRMSVL